MGFHGNKRENCHCRNSGCVFGAVNHLCEGRKPLICSLSLVTSSLSFLSAPGSLSQGLGHNVSEDSVVIRSEIGPLWALVNMWSFRTFGWNRVFDITLMQNNTLQ